MQRIGWVSATACAVAVAVGGAQLVRANGQDKDNHPDGRPCSAATIRGDYGIQIQGTRPAPGGLTESVVGVVLRNYDGEGNISQIDNVKGSITGIVPDRQGFGTYEVSPDCTGIARFQPGPGILLEERLVIVDDGREIRTMVLAPAGVMVTGVHQRIHKH
jgi:hypothetical protein